MTMDSISMDKHHKPALKVQKEKYKKEKRVIKNHLRMFEDEYQLLEGSVAKHPTTFTDLESEFGRADV